MRRSLLGLLITAAVWVALLGISLVLELALGKNPFGMERAPSGGRFLLIVIGFVLALGTAIGYASERIRHRG